MVLSFITDFYSVDSQGVHVFLKEWTEIRTYLYDFVTSDDPTLHHIAVWTLIQFATGDGLS